jgi:hypothetical protein
MGAVHSSGKLSGTKRAHWDGMGWESVSQVSPKRLGKIGTSCSNVGGVPVLRHWSISIS